MKRLLAAFLITSALAVGCATVGPIAIKCGVADVQIAAADYTEISVDFHAKPVNWPDLAMVAERIGWATFDCVAGDQAAKDPTIVPAVQEFKRQHAVEFRAAGVTACKQVSGGGVTAEVGPGMYGAPRSADSVAPGVRPVAGKPSLADCAAKCGTADAIAPPSGCSCWRPSKNDWRKSRWVPLAVAAPRGETSSIPVDSATGMSAAYPIGLTDYNDVACAALTYERETGRLVSVRRWYCEGI